MSEIPRIPEPKRTKESATNFIDNVIDKLDQKHVALVKNPWDLVKQLRYYDRQMSHFKTLFQRTDVIIYEFSVTHRVNNGYIANYPVPLCGGFRQVVKNKIYHIHPTSVCISSVLTGNTKIWTKQEKKNYQAALTAKNCPLGVDTNGDAETARFYMVIDGHCSEITKIFRIDETVRGSLVDMILIDNNDDQVGFALQIATASHIDGQSCYGKVLTVRHFVAHRCANFILQKKNEI
jgi:hypothetical protein